LRLIRSGLSYIHLINVYLERLINSPVGNNQAILRILVKIVTLIIINTLFQFSLW